MSIKILLVISVAVALLLLFALSRTQWFQRVKTRWLMLRFTLTLHSIKQSVDGLDSPKSKLKRARKAVEALRSGFWLNPSGEKIYLDLSEYSGIGDQLRRIREAMEAGFSYRRIGTTRDEVIGFRNGEAHKTSAQLQVALSRTLEQSPRCDYIVELAEDAGFTLEEVGTSIKELELLSREYSRQLEVNSVQRFREWAMGESDFYQDPDEFEELVSGLLSGEDYAGKFTYEEMGTSEQEYIEMMLLARRREVTRWVSFLKHEAEKGKTNNSITREFIEEALEKAGLTLSNFNMTDSDLDEIERTAFITKAKSLLDELSAPGEGWFYTSSKTNSSIRLYNPVLWGCIPGDPLFFVGKIKENLKAAQATLADIGTSESEIKVLVRDGHLASAKFLLKDLQRISQIPRRTQFEMMASMLGPQSIIIDDPNDPIDRETLEKPYPIDRDIEAIQYHLRGAGVELKNIGSSREKLEQLRVAIEAR